MPCYHLYRMTKMAVAVLHVFGNGIFFRTEALHAKIFFNNGSSVGGSKCTATATIDNSVMC